MVVGSLHELAARAHQHDVHSPALLIIGEVAALASELRWFGAAPLGETMAVAQHFLNPAAPTLASAA